MWRVRRVWLDGFILFFVHKLLLFQPGDPPNDLAEPQPGINAARSNAEVPKTTDSGLSAPALLIGVSLEFTGPLKK